MNKTNQLLTAEDGFILGLEMLREMGRVADADREAQPFAIEREYRAPGSKQANLVATYLASVREMQNPEVERGFAAFLTEYLSSCQAGCVPVLEYYEQIVESEII